MGACHLKKLKFFYFLNILSNNRFKIIFLVLEVSRAFAQKKFQLKPPNFNLCRNIVAETNQLVVSWWY